METQPQTPKKVVESLAIRHHPKVEGAADENTYAVLVAVFANAAGMPLGEAKAHIAALAKLFVAAQHAALVYFNQEVQRGDVEKFPETLARFANEPRMTAFVEAGGYSSLEQALQGLVGMYGMVVNEHDLQEGRMAEHLGLATD